MATPEVGRPPNLIACAVPARTAALSAVQDARAAAPPMPSRCRRHPEVAVILNEVKDPGFASTSNNDRNRPRTRPTHRHFERSKPTLFLSRLLLQTCRLAKREISLHLCLPSKSVIGKTRQQRRVTTESPSKTETSSRSALALPCTSKTLRGRVAPNPSSTAAGTTHHAPCTFREVAGSTLPARCGSPPLPRGHGVLTHATGPSRCGPQ